MAFDTPNSKKSLPSRVVNVIIFGIDEQCNLNLRPHCLLIVKLIIFFYLVEPALTSSYFFLSHFLVFIPSLILALRAIDIRYPTLKPQNGIQPFLCSFSFSLSLYSLPLPPSLSRQWLCGLWIWHFGFDWHGHWRGFPIGVGSWVFDWCGHQR